MLQSVAEEFAKMRFEKMDGIIGVLLTGSTVTDYVDALSDIDLQIVACADLCNRVGGECGFERFRNVDVWLEWTTLEELEAALKGWKDDIDLWVYSKARILFDSQNKIENVLSRYRKYPKQIWLEKLFLYWFFATGYAPYDSGKAIQRGDLLTAQLYLNQAIEYYTALIFIINRSFVPYRKWRLKELKKLAYVPHNYENTVTKVLTVKNWTKNEFEEKQTIILNMADLLKEKLQQAGVPREKLENPWKFKVTYVPRV